MWILFSSLDDVYPVRRYLKFETLVGKSLPNSPTVIDSLLLPARQALLKSMAIRVVEISNGGYKIRKNFA